MDYRKGYIPYPDSQMVTLKRVIRYSNGAIKVLKKKPFPLILISTPFSFEMALAPQFAGHRLGSALAPHTIELYLDYVVS